MGAAKCNRQRPKGQCGDRLQHRSSHSFPSFVPATHTRQLQRALQYLSTSWPAQDISAEQAALLQVDKSAVVPLLLLTLGMYIGAACLLEVSQNMPLKHYDLLDAEEETQA